MKAKILIILILPVVLASCTEEIRRCDLTKAQKQLIPYEKGLVISFIDSVGLTVDLTVTESQVSWTPKERYGGFIDVYVTKEVKLVILKSESNDLEVRLTICNSGGSECSNYSSLSIDINKGWEFSLKSNTKGGIQPDRSVSFYESIKINDKVYYDVVEQKCDYNFFDNAGGQYQIPMQLFYNKTYGILQFKKEGENILTLKN